MSRSRSQRRSNSASGNSQADAEVLDGLTFRPSVACGGKLSTSEYNLRSRKCTEEQLSRLQETDEYKTWSKTRSGQPWTAHLETAKAQFQNAKALVRSSPRAASAALIVIVIITAALVAPGAISTTKEALLQRPSTTTTNVVKQQTPPAKGVIERAPLSATPEKAAAGAPSVSTQQLEAMAAQLKAEQTRANAVAAELATARSEQQKTASKLAAASTREASLTEEVRKLSIAAKDAAKQAVSKTPTAAATITTSPSLLAIPGMALLCIEAVLAGLVALTVLSLRRSRAATETAKRQYLVAYRRQQAVLAMAEDTYTAAQQEAASVHKTIKAGAQQAAQQAHQAQQAAEQAQQAEQARDKAASAAAERAAAWAAAGTQLLQLTKSPSESTPYKKSKKGGGNSGADKEALPPSPTKVADAVAARCAELKSRIFAAEAAAAASAAHAEESQRDRVWNEQKAAETMTDNELLKEQLADSKKALGDAAARIAQVESALEETRQGLAAVEAERSILQKERDALQASLETEAEKSARLTRETSGLEAQVEQLTASLASEASAKAHAESRFQQVDSELNSLRIFAESLEMQKEALEAELADAKATIAHTIAQSHQTAADTFSASNMAASAAVTGGVHSQEGDLVPVPVLPSPSRSRGNNTNITPNNNNDGTLSGNNSAPHSARRTSSLSVRVGQIVNMLTDGMDGALAAASEGVVHSPGAMWAGASAPSSGRRTSRDSTGSTLSARLARASELFNVAERLLGQKLPGEGSGGGGNYGDGIDDMEGVRPYSDVPLLSAGAYTSSETTTDGAEAAVARVAAAVDQSRAEVARTLGALKAASMNNPAASKAAQVLENAQQKVDETLNAARSTAAAAAGLRADHASLAETARRRQADLESAQNALGAAMEGDGSPGGATSAAVANAAKHLTDAEAAQRIAAEAVYEAERAWHRAVSDDLATRNALVAAQGELSRARENAAGLVSPVGILVGEGRGSGADALSVSPRISLAPASPGVALRG